MKKLLFIVVIALLTPKFALGQGQPPGDPAKILARLLADAKQPERGSLLEQLPGKDTFLVPARGVRSDLLLREPAHSLPNQVMFRREVRILDRHS